MAALFYVGAHQYSGSDQSGTIINVVPVLDSLSLPAADKYYLNGIESQSLGH